MFFSPWVFNHFNILCGNFNIANFGYILTFRDKPSNFNSLPLKLCSKLMVDAISRWWAGKLKAISNCKWKRTQRKPNFNLYILLHLLKAFGPTSSSPSYQPLLSGSQMLWIEKSLTCEMTRRRGMWTWATHLDSIAVSVFVFSLFELDKYCQKQIQMTIWWREEQACLDHPLNYTYGILEVWEWWGYANLLQGRWSRCRCIWKYTKDCLFSEYVVYCPL